MDYRGKEIRKKVAKRLGKKNLDKLMKNTVRENSEERQEPVIKEEAVLQDMNYNIKELRKKVIKGLGKKARNELTKNIVKESIEEKQEPIVKEENFKQPEKQVKEEPTLEKVLKKDSTITAFKKVNGENKVEVEYSVKDEKETTKKDKIPVNSSVQLVFDKMEMQTETKVDFDGQIKDKILVLPFQNRVVHIEGITGKEKKSIPIDANLMYFETNSITGKAISIDSRLNPAILGLLRDDKIAQNDYINATGNIEVIYDNEIKSEKGKENRANKKLAKKMNEYYESEKEYVEELHLKNELSKKVGYVNIIDKIKTFFRKVRPKALDKGKENIENANCNDIKSTLNEGKDTIVNTLRQKYGGYQVKTPKKSIGEGEKSNLKLRGTVTPER